MNQIAPTPDRPASRPVVYRITIRGILEEKWGERLAGMTLTPSVVEGSGEPLTVLTGPIRDQAELSGVLNTLYGMHLTLVSVETLGEEPTLQEGEPR